MGEGSVVGGKERGRKTGKKSFIMQVFFVINSSRWEWKKNKTEEKALKCTLLDYKIQKFSRGKGREKKGKCIKKGKKAS